MNENVTSPAQPFGTYCSLGAVLGVAVALIAASIDGLLTIGSGGLAALPLAICLYGPVGLLIGLVVGGVIGALAESLVGDPSPWRRVRDEADLDHSVASAIAAASGSVMLLVAMLYLFAKGPAASMSNPRLAALSTGLVGGGCVIVCAALFLPIWRLLLRVARLLPRGPRLPQTVAVLLGGLLVVAAAAIFVLGGLDWRVLHFAPWVTLLALLAATVLLVVLFGRRIGDRWGGSWLVKLLLAILLGAGLGLAAPATGRSAKTVSAAMSDGLLSPLLISVARRIGDRDGDGFSAWFDGGDCDDANPRVFPGARDVPGNGIDENCIGGDAKKPTPARSTRATSQPTTRQQPLFEGNLLLVCVDTLRVDALSHPEDLTPNINRLASRGVHFAETFSQAANTPQSFPSFFTSLYPPRVPVRKKFVGYPKMTPEAETFFETLSAAGVATAAVTSHFYFKPERGITQGVADWNNEGATNIKDSNKDIASPRIVPRAIAKLKQLGAAANKRFVLFVHLSEPHSTYVKHPEYPITKRGSAGLRQKYDYEVKYVDVWVGKLLAALDAAGQRERTAVLLFSDHGEAFGEHKHYFHGQALYNEVLHVPLILAVPGQKPRVVNQRVALLDLAPTILELFGIDSPSHYQGISLLPALRGEALPERKLGAALMPYPAWPKGQQAMFSGQHKVIWSTTENKLEVYDLSSDPKEQRNLAFSKPALAKRLRDEFARFVEQQMQ